MATMRLLLSATLLATSSAAAATTATSASQTSSTAVYLFEDFVIEFGKEYGSLEEKVKAAQNFAANMQRVSDLGAQNPRATFSIRTRWADMTRDEFTAMHGHKSGDTPCQFPDPSMHDIVKLSPTAEPLDSLDYVALGATVAVKDQGSCSSCWAHATTAVVEGQLKLSTGNITSLSEQYLMDCDKSRSCKGCCGGLTEDSMQWLAGDSEGGTPGAGPGISSEAAYPYTSYDGTDPTEYRCDESVPRVATLTSWGVLANPNDESVYSGLTQYGPLSLGMDSHALQFYTSGVITNSSDCSNTNHDVALVGYGVDGDTAYYKVRNSYGESFGEDGYFRISPAAAASCGFYGCVVAGIGAGYL